MDDPLRPKSALELLSRTLRLYCRDFVRFAGLSIVGPVATFAYRLRYGGGTVALAHVDLASAAAAVLGVLVGIAIVLAGAAISSAATVEAVAAVSRGSRVRVAEGYRALGKRLWQIIGIVLSVLLRAFPAGLLCIVGGVIALAVAAALGYNSRVEAGIIGYVCGGVSLVSAIFASLWICARYAVAVQACVVESIGRRLALKRSRFLTAGDRGQVTILHFAFLLLVLAADFILGAPTLLLPSHGAAFRIWGAVAGFIAVALTSPVATIGMSLVYYDARAQGRSRLTSLYRITPEKPASGREPGSGGIGVCGEVEPENQFVRFRTAQPYRRVLQLTSCRCKSPRSIALERVSKTFDGARW